MAKVIDSGCDCCVGDKPLFYRDDNNCVFVGVGEAGKGELMMFIAGNMQRIEVTYCPNCGSMLFPRD